MNVLKEKYYSLKTIEQQASRFAEGLAMFREKHKVATLKPKKAALLIIDMQDFFLNEKSHAFIPSMPAIIPKLKNLQDKFLTNNLPVFHTKHGNTTENIGQMLNWWGSFLAEDDPLSEIVAELKDTKVPTIPKTQNDAFWQSDLEQRLKEKKDIKQVIIGGVMTHLCCESTARAAFTRGYEVFFLVDGTATYNKQFHFASLLNLAHGFAVQILNAEVANIMKHKG
jgi:bifunctional isochorismate lyase/aryl carrier protein